MPKLGYLSYPGRVDELTARAVVAYYRTGGDVQPNSYSGVCEHAGLKYVVLRNNTVGILAVFRVHNSGSLKRMVRRWPKAIETPR